MKTEALIRKMCVLLLVFVVGCSKQPSSTTELVRPVKTLLVSFGDDAATRVFPGKVEASKQVELAFQVPGLLVGLPVREGQKVSGNDVIAQLRQEEFQARLAALRGQLDRARADLQATRAGVRPEERQRLEAQVRSAEATLANSLAEYTRATQLLRSRTISRVEFERAETTWLVAQENLEAARRTLEQSAIGREEEILAGEAEVRSLEGRVVEANLQLEDSTLRAPYDGVIARRFVEQGQNIRAKQAVVTFQDVAEIEIVVDIPENVMADIRLADIVRLEAEFAAVPGRRFSVRINEVAQRADPVTQTFSVRAAMQVPEGLNLLPGMTASIFMTYQRAGILGGRILVPLSAIFEREPGQQAVWVVGQDQVVIRRLVKTGEATGGRIEVTEGLQPGDRIAVAGVTFLREGMKVRDLGDALGGSRP